MIFALLILVQPVAMLLLPTIPIKDDKIMKLTVKLSFKHEKVFIVSTLSIIHCVSYNVLKLIVENIINHNQISDCFLTKKAIKH